jgi:hypothetical protein
MKRYRYIMKSNAVTLDVCAQDGETAEAAVLAYLGGKFSGWSLFTVTR